MGGGGTDFQASQCIPMHPDTAAVADARCGHPLRCLPPICADQPLDVSTDGERDPKVNKF